MLENRPSRSKNSNSANQTAGRPTRTRRSKPNTSSLAEAPAGRPSPADGFDLREAREEMIRIAAYYLAEKRSFAPGAELDDWLAAEAEIDERVIE
jgi:hypothetical protein